MKLYASPLQGFTEAPWRNIHHELFGGIDAYYTPFVRVEKGEFRNKDIRDIEKENNKVTCLIPQLIASTPAELEKLVGLFLERGYREADTTWVVRFRCLPCGTRAPVFCLIRQRLKCF